jgi:hypothetical protein
MSAVASPERSSAGLERPQRDTYDAPLFDDGFTLEDRILGVWEDVVVEGSADCPVCGGSISPDGCVGCGSHLS